MLLLLQHMEGVSRQCASHTAHAGMTPACCLCFLRLIYAHGHCLTACICTIADGTSVHGNGICRMAIAQRRLPFNVSVVSDFMKSRDRFWKSSYADVPFTQIARTFEDEVAPFTDLSTLLLSLDVGEAATI